MSLESRRGDEAALLRFWAALGFERVQAPGALAERSTWVQRGPRQVHFLWAQDPVVMPDGHVAVVAGDYEATLATLRAEGFEPEARSEHWGAARSFVRSPGGHLVEVMAAAPPPA